MPKLSHLQKREKVLVYVLLPVMFLLVFNYVASEPLRKYNQARAAVKTARGNLQRAKEMHDEVVGSRRSAEALGKAIGANSVPLLPLIERQLGETGLRARANYASDVRFADADLFDQVRVTLTGVSMEELVTFLHRVHAAGSLVISHSVTIEPNQQGGGLKATLVLLSPKPK